MNYELSPYDMIRVRGLGIVPTAERIMERIPAIEDARRIAQFDANRVAAKGEGSVVKLLRRENVRLMERVVTLDNECRRHGLRADRGERRATWAMIAAGGLGAVVFALAAALALKVWL